MLEKLLIKNYLIIKEAEIDFCGSLNVLTGETGAGKTIILDALGLILGERADYSIIKNEREKLVVEGQFDFSGCKSVKKYIKAKNLLEEEQKRDFLIVRRELSKRGISRAFINDSPVSISDLKELGDLIIDIHSQNEHQSLLNKETQLEIIDSFLENKTVLEDFKHCYKNFSDKAAEYNNLLEKKDRLLEKKSFLEFQLKEINDISLIENEDLNLENELKKLENSEEISMLINAAMEMLYDGNNNAQANISSAIKELKKTAKYDIYTEKIITALEEGYENIKEAASELRKYSSSINFDQERTEEIRKRIGAINYIKKKYNLSVNELLKKAKEIEKELQFTENFDYQLEKVKKETESIKQSLINKSVELSWQRKAASKLLDNKINQYFKEIGLESADFKTKNSYFRQDKENQFTFLHDKLYTLITPRGIDDTEFLVMTNKGGEFTQLRKTASGGEISRIMLAIKASISDKDNIPILVFDEIDAGISGKVSGKVGKLLGQLSKTHQIIAITHLPQIAATGECHFHVNKKEKQKETIAEIKKLTNEDRVMEIAKLLSGREVTEASIKNAKVLLKEK